MSFVAALGLSSLVRAWKRNPLGPARELSGRHDHKERDTPFRADEIARYRESLEEVAPSEAAEIFAEIDDAAQPLPNEYRSQFVLGDKELEQELIAMTDAHTAPMFAALTKPFQRVRFPASRLLVDVERFEDDAQEIMSTRGMGVIYSQTAERKALRREISATERERLLSTYYRPHHAKFTQVVEDTVRRHGRALIVDAHSFPSEPRPYELDQTSVRPEICIGTDRFHTPRDLAEALLAAFRAEGFTVAENVPFAGTIVPMCHYQTDRQVQSVMIEANRSLYMDGSTGARKRQVPGSNPAGPARVCHGNESIRCRLKLDRGVGSRGKTAPLLSGAWRNHLPLLLTTTHPTRIAGSANSRRCHRGPNWTESTTNRRHRQHRCRRAPRDIFEGIPTRPNLASAFSDGITRSPSGEIPLAGKILSDTRCSTGGRNSPTATLLWPAFFGLPRAVARSIMACRSPLRSRM